MKVTYVNLNFPTEKDRMPPDFKCWAKVTLDDIFVISEIKLFERENKETNEIERFIRLPSHRFKVPTGEFVHINIVSIRDDDIRLHITEEICKKYDRVVQKYQSRNGSGTGNSEE
jgi:DNA-binding cell septation regulator SpoVG